MTDDHEKSVYIEPVEGVHAVRMVWLRSVRESDIPGAFKEIQAALDASAGPLDVIVDMSRQPNIPMQTTLWNALRGPFRDKRLREWLCFGGGGIAVAIGRVLTGATGRSNVRWFDDEAGALAYLRERETRAP